ncbi:MAG: DUF4465 domain-containing protein [Planctomycetes bacterium]|nr:DUF4465 domain-containing protein [Planctomycetota bacterium]
MRCNRWIQTLTLLVGTLGTTALVNAGTVVDFEDIPLPSSTSAGNYYDGSDSAGGFVSQGVGFNNDYNTTFSSWTGWAASNSTDTTTAGFANQYSAFPGNGAVGSANFGVAFDSSFGPAEVTFAQPTELAGTYITNGTYPALSMLNGDAFAKKFGGISGNDPDWFKLAIFGKDMLGNTTGTVDFYLADYRFVDNSQDYVVDDWAWVDLASLGTQVQSLEFELTSSDNGMFGMNTPSYFLVDNLIVTHANFNGDTTVDSSDLVIWEQNFGTANGATNMTGDANGDGDVDGRDFLVWQRQFNGSAALLASEAVPEPTSCILAAGLAVLALGRRSRL